MERKNIEEQRNMLFAEIFDEFRTNEEIITHWHQLARHFVQVVGYLPHAIEFVLNNFAIWLQEME